MSSRASLSTRRLLAGLCVLLALAAGALPSFADAGTENTARKLQQEAMDIDFLALDLKKAKAKLNDALKKCGKDKCGKTVIATLHRDLGIVMINSNEKDAGEKAFAAAFANDSGVTIAKEFLDNVEVKKAWEAAKKKAGGGGTTTATTPTSTGPGPTEPPPGPAEGGLGVKLTVAPAGFEIPVVIEVPKGTDVKTIKVSYKTDTMEKYKAIEAKKAGAKGGIWLAIIDCSASSSPTTIKMFIKALDSDGQEVEHYGTIKKPAIVKVVEKVADDADIPLLPGDKEPKSCTGGEDGGKKPEGAGCENDEECEKGLVCILNDSGKKWCKPGDKKGSSDGSPKIWVGIDGMTDVALINEETNICKQKYWACTVDSPSAGRLDVGGDDPKGIIIGPNKTGGKTTGGPSRGTARITISLDYFVSKSLSLGMRLGYALGGNPTNSAKFVPLHAEARLQYFFIDGGFRPFVLFAGGFAMMDSPVPNVIVEPNDITQVPEDIRNKQGDVDVVKGVTGYKLVGPGFAALGAGVWIMLGNKAALSLGMKIDFPLPVFSLAFSPELGFKVGF